MSFLINKTTVVEKNLDSVINDFINKIKSEKDEFNAILGYIESKNETLNNFIKEEKSDLMKINQLAVLRKWNSYTPILPEKEDIINKGGGYFISYNNTGIVIDPGYNFIENFLNAGYRLDDIDIIFISHAHDDHTAQLEAIFSLLYKRNKRSEHPKQIELYLNLGSFKKFAGFFDLTTINPKSYINKIFILNEHHHFDINPDISVFISKVKHHEMITANYSVGLTFSLGNQNEEPVILKFTCDTGWDTKIENENEELMSVYKINNIDILVCHIGSIKKDELDYDINKSFADNESTGNILYGYHLGLIGVVAEIHKWNPNIALISEFGQELNAVRIKIADKIQSELKCPTLPVDINFKINLDDFKIQSYKTKKYHDVNNIIPGKKDDGSIVFYNKNELSASELLDEQKAVNIMPIY